MKSCSFSRTVAKMRPKALYVLIFMMAVCLSSGCSNQGSEPLSTTPQSSSNETIDGTGDDVGGGSGDTTPGDIEEVVSDNTQENNNTPGESGDDDNFVPSDTLLMSFIPEKADGIISLNLANAGQSDVFNELFEEIKGGQAVTGYMDFIEKTGIDLQNDIDSAAIAEIKGQNGEASSLILARLNRAGNKLVESLMNNGFTMENYNGFSLLSDADDSVAFLNQDTLAIGAMEQVKVSIDMVLGYGRSIITNEKLNYLIDEFDPESLISFAYEYPEDAKINLDLGGLLALDLTKASAVTGNLKIINDIVTGGISIVASNSNDLVKTFNSFKEMVGQGGGSLGNSLKNITLASMSDRVVLSISSMLESAGLIGSDLSAMGITGRVLIKRLLYGMMPISSAIQILRGKEQPIIDFVVEDTSPSIFYNFIVPDNKAQALANAIPLPDNFTLAKVSCLEGDSEPHYYVSLNIYRVSGITTGLRAEWSTYVYDANDPSGRPRFMVMEVRTNAYSMDPIDIITLPSYFKHDLENDRIATMIKDTKYLGGLVPYKVDYFESTIDLSGGNYTTVKCNRDWIAANDYIFWKNGICDRSYYNGRLHNAVLLSVDSGAYTFKDSSKWADFIQAEPDSVLVFKNKLEFAVSPWFNIFDENLQMNYSAKRSRQFIKCVLYAMTSLGRAAQIIAGSADPLIRFDVAKTPPSIFINYRVQDKYADALAEAVPLPEGCKLAKLRLLESDSQPYYYLSLNIYAVTGITSGLRAEWQTFAYVPNDPVDSAKPRCMVVDLSTDKYSMDPINIITFPRTVEHSIEGNTIYSYAEAPGGTSFESTITLPDENDMVFAEGKQEWLEANDYIYWHNGICDKAFYNGNLLNMKILSIDPSDVSINDTTKWINYTDPKPRSVIIFMNGIEFVISPWWNL